MFGKVAWELKKRPGDQEQCSQEELQEDSDSTRKLKALLRAKMKARQDSWLALESGTEKKRKICLWDGGN